MKPDSQMPKRIKKEAFMATRKKATKADKKIQAKEIKKGAIAVPQKDTGFYIVGIGASAGGLEAFERFFKKMPNNPGMAFILVPHLDPTHVSLMPELIQKCSKMEVIQVKDGIEVQPNAVYIVPPNNDLAIINATLQLLQPLKSSGPRMPIDYFFRSLAQDQAEKAICIILSGMGTDGTLGLRAIKGELGMAVAQDPDTAKYDSMPRSAIATDLVDHILSPEKMPQKLIAYANHTTHKTVPKLVPVMGKTTDVLQKIFIVLRSQTGHDFSAYKHNTICRRIERRMDVHQIDKISNYVRYLQENGQEVNTLFKELLIGVTNFFRDKDAFEVLKNSALSRILEGKPKDYVIRAWVAGCSTGEEAYSTAIILRECTERLKQHVGIQIFATDIDDDAIETARAGVYPASISVDVSAERLKRFFAAEDNVYHVRKDIREMLVFAPQDIIKDPPFTKLDLICCRNLLIYLDSTLQKKLLPLFHYSLKPGGILFLGSSETTGGVTDLFSPIDKKWKIFRRQGSWPGARPVVPFPVTPPVERADVGNAEKPLELNLRQLAEKALLDSYVPPSVIINAKGDILYIHGRTGRYLEPAAGEAKWNIYDMARQGLKLELPSAIRKANSQKKAATYKGLQVRINGGTETVNLTVKPLMNSQTPTELMIVLFEAIAPPGPNEPAEKRRTPGKKTDERIEALEKELQYSKENLQTTIEELETSNEELNSTNEELQSTNEELQSTNEELETSKEEQQSLNEELMTVNSELQSKIEELTTANNDMKNLLDSTQIPTIFLDLDLCIKSFTSHATSVINLIHTDLGRPIGDIVTKLEYGGLTEDARAVLKDLVYREKEVQSKDGPFYTVRIAPYRTLENVIDGVVITFVDITQIKNLEAEHRLAAVVKDSNDAITVQDFAGNITAWNKGAEAMYGYREAEALNMNIKEVIPQGETEAELKFLQQIKAGIAVKPFRTKRKTKDGRILDVWLTLTRLDDDAGNPIEIATTERDLAWLAKI
jgi:two-component system CheB/CheR fusion protein